MMTIQPIHQNPADLALAVTAGEPDLSLTILREKTVVVGEWALRFHIIGESHLVTVLHKDRAVLAELLACVDIPTHACIHHHRFNDLAAHCYSQMGYQVDVHLSDDPGTPFGADSLLVEFPRMYNLTPVTRLEWQSDEGGVRWRTLHTYPQERGVVYVHSISHFEWPNYNRVI
jgi:hypothetical protein